MEGERARSVFLLKTKTKMNHAAAEAARKGDAVTLAGALPSSADLARALAALDEDER